MGWNEDIEELADRCSVDPKELGNWLTLTKQGYEHHLADLIAEPTTKEGKETLTALRNQLRGSSPNLKKIKKKLVEVESMRVGGRTYPLVDGALLQRIIDSDEISEKDQDQLIREVDHIIDQDRSRSTRGAGVNARDWLIIELVGLWKGLTDRGPDLSAKAGAFLDFAKGASDIIGVDAGPIPKRFERLKEQIPDL